MLHPDNTWKQLQIDASRYAENFMPYTNGMKLALQAYHDWTKKKGLDERRIPGEVEGGLFVELLIVKSSPL